MSYSAKIIERFGGVQSLTDKLGYRFPSKVQYWKDQGTIPQKHWETLRDLAKGEGFELSASDFVDFEDCA